MAQHRANDGQYYSDKQYEQAAALVRAHLESQDKEPLPCISHWWITGAVAGYMKDETPFEYYMRDLVLGIVREDGYDDYRKAVDAYSLV